jgi:hypothetical protein
VGVDGAAVAVGEVEEDEGEGHSGRVHDVDLGHGGLRRTHDVSVGVTGCWVEGPRPAGEGRASVRG